MMWISVVGGWHFAACSRCGKLKLIFTTVWFRSFGNLIMDTTVKYDLECETNKVVKMHKNVKQFIVTIISKLH